jgi:hypothetical protein
MNRSGRRGRLSLAAVLSLGTLALVAGCDWLTGSESVQRNTPFLSDLHISRSAVLCGREFSIAFHYDDPQGDIARIFFKMRLDGAAEPYEDKELPWRDDINQYTGTFPPFTAQFNCGTPGGDYLVTVEVEDDKGHRSNILTGKINLNSA